MAQRAGKLVERDTCSNRNDQRVFIQAGGDFAKHFNHDAWFNGGKNDVGDLRYFLRRFCGVDAELFMQGGDFIREGYIPRFALEAPDRWQSDRREWLFPYCRSQ
ncbi:hypothetical protein MUTS16_26610 [Escherichia coli]|nr:hypothetical protein MUTS16_26610 [Escherichia coli]